MSPLPNPVTNKVIYRQESFSPIIATGGTVYDITIDGAKYRVHEFTTVGTSTFTVSSLGSGLHPYSPGNPANSVEYLVIGGGSGGNGGNGINFGNGGAAGVARAGSKLVTAQDYSVVVGNGSPGTQRSDSLNGESSSIFGVTATGGFGSPYVGQTGPSNEDYNGGIQTFALPNSAGGAGAGGNAFRHIGGTGFNSDITGVAVRRGGGGGGILNNTGQPGGSGGGGKGANTNQNGENGVANTGSGGGAGRSNTRGGNGGSGIVIIRYPIM